MKPTVIALTTSISGCVLWAELQGLRVEMEEG